MWHKAEWMGRPMRLELTRVDLLVKVPEVTLDRLKLMLLMILLQIPFKQWRIPV